MDSLKEIFSYFLAAMAMLSLLCAVYEAMSQRLASSGVLAALFVAAAFLLYLPQLETFKAFAVEVRLRQSLDRAEEILGRLKGLVVISAKVSYVTLAWGNRMGSPSAKDKQVILDGVDEQLLALKVTEDERREIARPFVQFIGFDLYMIYRQVFDRLIMWKHGDLTRRLNTNPTPEGQKALQTLSNELADWRRDVAGNNPFEDLKNYDLAGYLRRTTPTKMLDDNERSAAERFAAEVVSLYDGCRIKGGFTPEAAQFQDKYGDIPGYDLKMKELFGVEFPMAP